MCEYCHSYPHKRGCPNYEPKVYGCCEYCQEPIVEGDYYYDFEGKTYHSDCISEAFTVEEVLGMLGINKETAGEEY